MFKYTRKKTSKSGKKRKLSMQSRWWHPRVVQ